MISKSLRQAAKFDELQFGTSLGQALQAQRQQDFALMLAMLSPDVTDQAWVSDPVPLYKTQAQLQRQFGLSRSQLFQNQSQHNACILHRTNIDWHLAVARHPEITENMPNAQSNVVHNVRLTAQLKQKYTVSHEPLVQSPEQLLQVLRQVKPV